MRRNALLGAAAGTAGGRLGGRTSLRQRGRAHRRRNWSPTRRVRVEPTDYPISRQASALASHLIYGLTVEGERRVLPGQADAA